LGRRALLRGRVLVVSRCDRGAASVAAAGDLGRRQLGAGDSPCAGARRRLAPLTRLRPRARPPGQGGASGAAGRPTAGAGDRRRDAGGGGGGGGRDVPGRAAYAGIRQRATSRPFSSLTSVPKAAHAAAKRRLIHAASSPRARRVCVNSSLSGTASSRSLS